MSVDIVREGRQGTIVTHPQDIVTIFDDEPRQLSFDYSEYPEEASMALKNHAVTIRGIVVRAADEVGRELWEAKQEIHRYKKDGWAKWVEAEIGWTVRYADKLISRYLAKNSGTEFQNCVEQPVEPKEDTDRVGNSPSLDDRRKTVEDFLSQTPNWREMSHRAIARICGVDHKTVATIIKDLFPEPESEPETELETISEPEPEIVSVMEVEPTTEPELEPPMLPEAVEDNLPETPEPEPELKVEPELGKVVEPEPQPELEAREDGKAKKSTSLTALQSSESNEWYTPLFYLEAVRELMGDIDLDPASCETANHIVQARRYYTEEDDGLAWDWWADEDETMPARVFLNPPYGIDEEGKSNQEVWSHRLISQYEMGFVSEAILLVNANTEAKWFQPLYNYPICLTNHRIHFWNSEGESDQPTQGNAFIYFPKRYPHGSDLEGTRDVLAVKRFIHLFNRFGTIVQKEEPLQDNKPIAVQVRFDEEQSTFRIYLLMKTDLWKDSGIMYSDLDCFLSDYDAGDSTFCARMDISYYPEPE